MATTADREASGGTLEGGEPELLRRLYEVMVLTRAVEDRMVTVDRGGDLLGSLYSEHWHEAISVGAASCLRADDDMAPWQIMASFMGKATSPPGNWPEERWDRARGDFAGRFMVGRDLAVVDVGLASP